MKSNTFTTVLIFNIINIYIIDLDYFSTKQNKRKKKRACFIYITDNMFKRNYAMKRYIKYIYEGSRGKMMIYTFLRFDVTVTSVILKRLLLFNDLELGKNQYNP